MKSSASMKWRPWRCTRPRLVCRLSTWTDRTLVAARSSSGARSKEIGEGVKPGVTEIAYGTHVHLPRFALRRPLPPQESRSDDRGDARSRLRHRPDRDHVVDHLWRDDQGSTLR